MAPPEGYRLDHALGTTYTLDLLALLRVPLAATALPWARADGEALDNPFALLSALRENAARVSLFCHEGAVKVPPRLQPLLTFLERSVHGVSPPGSGVFHPKLWLLRFVDDEDVAFLRLVVLSRNLTFDRSWDVALTLEGRVGGRRHAANRPLEDLLKALPSLATSAGNQLDSATLARLELLADEARRANWEVPEDFYEPPIFHAPGTGGAEDYPLDGFGRLLAISPFVTATFLQRVADSTRELTVVARPDELSKVGASSLEGIGEVYAFEDELESIETSSATDQAATDGDLTTDLRGLHAKVLVGEANRRAHVFVGSANATAAGWDGTNMELVVELEGSRSAHGIDRVLNTLKDAQLVRPYHPAVAIPEGSEAAIERELEQLAHVLSCGAVYGAVTEVNDGRYRVDLRLEKTAANLDSTQIEARPLSERLWRRVDPGADPAVSFPPVSLNQVTAFTALKLTRSEDGKEVSTEFVTRVPLKGLPLGRAEAVTAELLSDRDRLLRFLLLLLADTPGETDGILDGLAAAAEAGSESRGGGGDSTAMPLLEPILRTLHREPDRLDEVERVIADIRRHGAADTLPSELDELWTALAAVRRASG